MPIGEGFTHYFNATNQRPEFSPHDAPHQIPAGVFHMMSDVAEMKSFHRDQRSIEADWQFSYAFARVGGFAEGGAHATYQNITGIFTHEETLGMSVWVKDREVAVPVTGVRYIEETNELEFLVLWPSEYAIADVGVQPV